MFCYKCGKEIDSNEQYCPFCGAEQKKTINIARQKQDNRQGKQQKPAFFVKKPKLTIIILACIIGICLAGIGLMLFLSSQGKDQVISADNISVSSFDADWDSAYYDEKCETFKVDIVLLVKNDSQENISGIQFNAEQKDGEVFANALSQGEPFRADGYVKKGGQGIMVGTVWTDKKGKVDIITPSAAYKYRGEDSYSVPEGEITDGTGINNDLYSIQIDNPNSVEIGPTATLVAVLISEDKIKDSDATGRIEEPIAANSQGNIIKKVFQDPGFKSSYKKYKVIAIDSNNYR